MSNEEKNRYYWSLMADDDSSRLSVEQYLWRDEPEKTAPRRSKNRSLLWVTGLTSFLVLGTTLYVPFYKICQQKIPAIKRYLSHKEVPQTLSFFQMTINDQLKS